MINHISQQITQVRERVRVEFSRVFQVRATPKISRLTMTVSGNNESTDNRPICFFFFFFLAGKWF